MNELKQTTGTKPGTSYGHYQSMTFRAMFFPLNNLEMEPFIRMMYEQNPFLEITEPDYTPDDARKFLRSGPKTGTLIFEPVAERTLRDSLYEQLNCCKLNEIENSIGNAIIEHLDENGFFPYHSDLVPILVDKAFGNQLTFKPEDIETEMVEKVLDIIRHFNPLGIAAMDTRHALLIQIEDRIGADSMEYQIVDECYTHLIKSDWHTISVCLDVNLREVEDAVAMIRLFDPMPGRDYSSQTPEFVIPDLILRQSESGEYEVVYNDMFTSRLSLNQQYVDLLRNGAFKQTGAMDMWRNQYCFAKILLRAIEQRRNFVLCLTQELVKLQQEFLHKGWQHLKPLLQKDLAWRMNCDESTISRTVNAKYLQTDQGALRLSDFFSSGGVGGKSQSEIYVLIKSIIAAEDKAKPLSDQKISEELAKHYQLQIARRTVAKYRELMDIPGASIRRGLLLRQSA